MKSFQEMQLPADLQKGLTRLNFEKPTAIQAEVIPIALENKDLMACAETGSGKTAAFGIPMVIKLLENPRQQGLILAPTRELAQQISDFLRELTFHCQGFLVTSLTGGADIRRQLKALKRKPRIVVATPGRLIDHLKRKSLQLNQTGILVLDEGDRMLDMGFAPQLDEIKKYLPQRRQTSLFTATLPKKVQQLAENYLSQPHKINVGRVSRPVAAIRQSILELSGKEKQNRIVDELNQRSGSVIIFTRTKQRTDSLAKNLSSFGFAVDLIHGGRSQGQRNRAIQNFKNGRSRILCATDIAARGIDIPQVEHVINFDLPLMAEDYVHRIGRTGRNGASGQALSFVTPEDRRTWQFLEKKYQIEGASLTAGGQMERPRFKKKSRRPRPTSRKRSFSKR